MKFLRKIRSRRGMTLVELLIVVAIIAVLVCIGVVMINPQDLSYVEYNRCAESIATAVQNRLTALRNAGQLADLRTLGIVNDPAGEGTEVKTGASDEYRYIFNFEKKGTPNSNSSIRYFVPFGSIELQLEQGYFAIGFQAQSGMVGEVFYSENPFDHSVDFLKKLSDVTTGSEGKTIIKKGEKSKERKEAGIGYYVGEVDVREVAPAQLPTPQLTISNSEELTLSIYLPQVSQLVTYGKKLAVRVCLADAEGKAYSENKLTYEDTTIYSSYENIADYSAENDGLEMGKTYKIVLDTPDPAHQCDIQTGNVRNKSDISKPLSQTPKACFETWANETQAYRGDEGSAGFCLGDNVQITVFVYCLDDNGKVDNTYMERSASVVFNGWFDTFDGKHTVTIASGRHLQNLGNMTVMNSKLKELLPTVDTSGKYSNYSRGNAYQFTDEDSHVDKKWDYRKNSVSHHIVQDNITTARQVKSIDFNNSVWKKGNGNGNGNAYDYIPFTPVNLPSGFTYYGNYQTIRHLWVDAPFYAGLFGYVYNVNLYDIMLVNPHVESHMPAYVAEIYEMGVGALIGTSRDSKNIYNCQAFMEAEGGTVDASGHVTGGSYETVKEHYRILGNGYVGGLIGFCEDEYIRQNSASVYTGNLDGTSLYVGGLIGAITGDSNVKRCYGAGNLTGQYVGGLIGVVMEDSNSAGDNYYIEACYTAGHIEAATKSAAGLIGRVWEQGGYYKSALGANSNYCVVIYTVLEYCKDPAIYDSERDEIKNKLYDAWDKCDYLYHYFDDDSRYNAAGLPIKNVEDALDSTGRTEPYSNSSGGMRSLRKRIDEWRSSLKSLAGTAKATIPSSTLRDFQYILERLEDVKKLSGPDSDFWNSGEMSKHKTTVDGMVDKAIDAMNELISAYETYKQEETSGNKDAYLNKMNTAWNRIKDLYDYFDTNETLKDTVDVVDSESKLKITEADGEGYGMRAIRAVFSAGSSKLESKAGSENYELNREKN